MQLTEAFKALISLNATVLDIGSFDGGTAAMFAELVGPEGRVYAFEPHPAHYLKLSSRASAYSPRVIHPYCRAVSNYRGHTSLYVSERVDATHDQASTTVESLANAERLGSNFVKLIVETCRLDDVCADFSLRPNFIKIDVEGAEDRVFAGATHTLTSCSPYIIFECGWVHTSPIPPHIGELEGLGYDLYCVDIMFAADKWVSDPYPYLTRVSRHDFETAPTFIGNILAVPLEKKKTFPLRGQIATQQLAATLKSL